MSRRWTEAEELGIAEIRSRLKDLIAEQTPFPEVVGDRRLLRFLRGKQMNIDDATDLYRDFLVWRRKNSVDQIRQEILYGGRNSPFFFPKGKTIIDLAPQIIVTPHSRDRLGRPLCLEQYCFNPKDVLKVVTREEYLYFLTYALEYRAMVMEQLSHEMEEDYLRRFPREDDRVDGYGVILLDYTIRDLKGVGFNHLGSDGRAILKAALDIGLPNYPEYLGKSHMINVPTLFSTMWYFLKQILDEPTQAKFEFSGYDYLNNLQKDIAIENIPTCLGGEFELYNEPFTFDTSPTGPFGYAQAETDRAAFLRRTPRLTFDAATAEVRQAQFYDELHPASVTTAAASAASATATSTPPQTATNCKPSTAPPATATTNTKDTSKMASVTAASTPAAIAVTAKVTARAALTSTVTTAMAAVSNRVIGLVHFWVAFVAFAWQQHRWMTIGGGVSSLALLVYEPPAFHALVLVVLLVVVSRSW
eukprot:gene14146-10099_t